MNYRRTRLIYQIVFTLLFFFLILASIQDNLQLLKNYPVKLFLNMSSLSGIGTIISQHNLVSGMMLGIFIASLCLFLGRFFCGWICPMGSCQHLASSVFTGPDKKIQYKKNNYSDAHKVKYIILIVFLVSACFGVILSGYFDPISLMTRFSVTIIVPLLDVFLHKGISQTVAFQASFITALIFVSVFFLNIYSPRFWCRNICPMGALLSVFSLNPVWRMSRDRDKCIDCGLCHQNCQGGCEIDRDFMPSECLMCMNCIDLCPVGAIDFKSCPSKQDADKTAGLRRGLVFNRRDFVTSGLLALVSAGTLKNFKNIQERGFPKRIRPPGALLEKDFLARCIRCGQCLKVCPTNVIQGALTETDPEGLWTPVLNMQYGFCQYDCNLCSQVCPTGAIKNISVVEKHEAGYGRIGTAFVDRSRCLPWSFGRTCLVCQEVCPVSPKAIYQQKRKFMPEPGKTKWLDMPYVKPELCIGCGICENKCPVQDKPAVRVTSIGESRNPQRKLTL